ncbi:bifunctional 4-hydroxy-2-oxoglutarate aldolase/2-dehydro-3-deoxy-phosphogluconate aldolase [Cutibacterium equinum]|uniref:Bifunctional 4-hydroxy-2-oxoglutarate aldolase/2-dehydro-3-deoxy-phosphogluconate aldolase n=1 Tax=Cutibacterium equinum TaxID=3016342 RepID=A0ABY7QXL4_9ACTN|nr:bifunctional 4-hydroxy-2-oxoglutarate aldolase/2-dehydro-3-deoxy-phosphogluconate aldolase [Cutibacterium equinum]WCC79780.1 bifunctional 4-hydroxy-2-oxoglutarate aldolase/2-dehydro-3-deoxy-phosphogluconate aldolase [Cutibacterium equinum]
MSAEVDEPGPIDVPTDGRLVFPDEVRASKIIAVLPDVASSDLMAPIEVMIQEKVRAFTLPVADAERRRAVLKIYRRRAVIGVHGVMTVDDVQGLVDDKVAFALPVAATPELLDALRQAGIPSAPDALTPTEVRAAWAAGADAVQVAPADMGSASYGDILTAMAPGVALVPRGGVGSYALRRWLASGALAVCLDEVLVGDVCADGVVSALRERCRSVLQVVADAEA